MMWLVRLALKRPYTFVVMSMLIVILGVVTILRMPTDIFPDIDIPVISVVWSYPGLSPEEMEKRIVNNYERALTTTVNDIEHMESQTLTGIAVIKIFFQPGAQDRSGHRAGHGHLADRAAPDAAGHDAARSSSATARRTSQSCSSRSRATRSASSSSSTTGPTSSAADIATIQGAQMPWPYGGKQRQIMVDIDPAAPLRVGSLPARREQRAQRAERHRPDRHGEDRASTSIRSSSTRAPSSSTRSPTSP